MSVEKNLSGKSMANMQGDVAQGDDQQNTGESNTDVTIDDNACVVCFKNVDLFSVGECDHPVCYECSTRMRVLCQQNECPICRQVLSKVIFTYNKLSYRELEARNRSEYYSKKYKIGFYTSEIQQKFFELLDHPCPKCHCPPYRTFQGLRNHVRKEHDLYFCDLCVENLKIFTFERRCYTQAELGLHRTKGDPDNRSHRGHPLCEYCNKRYLDRDELFRHLRREHYYCHFCDADGCNEFYRDYNALADHFRQDHYLCEEGRCATEEFTGAFRTEIDYKAHVANIHGKGMNKQQAKQTRTLQLEITLGPRGRSGQTEQGVANMRSRGNNDVEPEMEEPSYYQAHSTNQQRNNIDPCSEQEFPSLAGTATGPSVSLTRPPPPAILNRSRMSGLARTKENFPALGGAVNNIGGNNSSGGVGPMGSNRAPPHSSNVLRKQHANATGAIPRSNVSNNMPSTSTNGMVIHVSNRPSSSNNANSSNRKSSGMDFPALPMGKSKKSQAKQALLEEDMPTSGVQLPMSSVPSKHRSLVDDYVSVANPANFQKIQMVQKEEMETKARKEAEARNAPKLTTQDFPSLGLGSSAKSTPTNTWIKSTMSEKKQKDLENRKNKIAPAPLLTKNNVGSTKQPNITNGNNQNNNLSNNKKDKKPKEKKANENKTSNNNSTNGKNGQSPLRPPPGFQNSNSSMKPPPGFQTTNVTVNSVAKSPNNLTFTSSLGESYSILPAYSYIAAPDALARNQKLVGFFRDALKTPEGLEEFRHISQKFREGVYKTDAYYEHCQAALKDKFDKVFPELLVLLPDISKQQALYLVHQQRLNNLSPQQRKSLPKLEVCSTCKQVLMQNDLEGHRKMHTLTQNFPKLNGGQKSTTTT
ncbi:E3 ubiquitin-protein ligase ZNF598 [Calliphora vicina]|uniref:E3 ubiquitin-protein ligase ZNF598 n=1 Tax=Calliphora vicina TaxID=7373 RepID=UPI00325B7407